MSLNIKNERTHALVRELAERTGLSQTAAVEDAVVRRLAELSRPRVDVNHVVADLLLEIRSEITEADRVALRGAVGDLYDEAGLPR